MDKLLLQFGNVKETVVRSVEQRDAQRKVNAHGEVLDVVGKNHRHGSAYRVGDLAEDPIHMKKSDCRE